MTLSGNTYQTDVITYVYVNVTFLSFPGAVQTASFQLLVTDSMLLTFTLT